MDPDSPPLWRLLRDIGLFGIGCYMLLHETHAKEPSLAKLMTGCLLVLGPAAIRTVVRAYFRVPGREEDDR